MQQTVAAYLRDGPGCPADTDAQLAAVRSYAAQHGWTVGPIYRDACASRTRRPGRDALVRDGASKACMVVVHSMAALGRTLPDLVRVLGGLAEMGIAVHALDAADAASGALMAALPALMAADARLRQEAVLTGKAKARSKGVRFGRPPVKPEKLDRVRSALATGMGIRPTARAAGVSPATVLRVRAALSAAPVVA